MTLPLSIVVAVADNGVIGRGNRLVWKLRTDLKRFRALTWGRPMIMGRKTHESIGVALPGRETVVVTRRPGYEAPGIHVAHDWPGAVALADRLGAALDAREIAVVGGAEIFALALPSARTVHLTRVHASPAGDVLMPDFDLSDFREVRREAHPAGPDDEHPFTFLDLERRRAAAPA